MECIAPTPHANKATDEMEELDGAMSLVHKGTQVLQRKLTTNARAFISIFPCNLQKFAKFGIIIMIIIIIIIWNLEFWDYW